MNQQNQNSELSIGVKLLVGALVGWGVAILAIMVIFQYSKVDQWTVFLALAPGSIIGILVVYITNKDSNKRSAGKPEVSIPNPEVKREPKKSISEQLIQLKELYDNGILTESEFNKLKNNILEEFNR